MPRKPAKPVPAPAPVRPPDGFDGLVGRIAAVSDALREGAVAVVNRSVTARAWLTGCYIVEYEQHGRDRAQYGERLLQRLAQRLAARGFALANLKNAKAFYLAYPELAQPVAAFLIDKAGKRQSLSGLLLAPALALPVPRKSQTVSGLLVHRPGSDGKDGELAIDPDALFTRLPFSQPHGFEPIWFGCPVYCGFRLWL